MIDTRNSTDKALDAIKPGHSIELSRSGEGWVIVDRSADGKTLRFYRCTATTQTLFHKAAY